jgi:hypothetical protein
MHQRRTQQGAHDHTSPAARRTMRVAEGLYERRQPTRSVRPSMCTTTAEGGVSAPQAASTRASGVQGTHCSGAPAARWTKGVNDGRTSPQDVHISNRTTRRSGHGSAPAGSNKRPARDGHEGRGAAEGQERGEASRCLQPYPPKAKRPAASLTLAQAFASSYASERGLLAAELEGGPR